jgi:RNA polymerase sigma factor (sigma-70 family)
MTPASPIEPGSSRFPTTRRSAILGIRSSDEVERTRSFDALAAAYWKPTYKYIRLRFGKSSADAQDLTQAFFLRVIEKEFFAAYDPGRGRFRTFLRTCLDRFLANQHQAERREKRGGGVPLLPLDIQTAEGEIESREIPSNESPERLFEVEWVRSVFGLAVEALRAEFLAAGREVPFRVFARHDLDEGDGDPPSYADLAREFSIPVTTVTNHLSLARREFRRLLLETLRDITATDDEYRLEARLLLGIDVE